MYGLYMEGARWDTMQGVIMESNLKDLFPMLPVINIRVSLDFHFLNNNILSKACDTNNYI